jgi:sortase A
MKRLGTVLILAGVVMLFGVGYIAVDPRAKYEQNSAVVAAEENLKAPSSSKPRVAIMEIPALGKDWKKVVSEGVDDESLALGIGHYPGTVHAGDEGTAAYAGHRSGKGNPLLDIEKVQKGDTIIVRDASGDYVYEVTETRIVSPTDTSVLTQRKGKWLVLTTCWPKWGNEKRYVLFAQMS